MNITSESNFTKNCEFQGESRAGNGAGVLFECVPI